MATWHCIPRPTTVIPCMHKGIIPSAVVVSLRNCHLFGLGLQDLSQSVCHWFQHLQTSPKINTQYRVNRVPITTLRWHKVVIKVDTSIRCCKCNTETVAWHRQVWSSLYETAPCMCIVYTYRELVQELSITCLLCFSSSLTTVLWPISGISSLRSSSVSGRNAAPVTRFRQKFSKTSSLKPSSSRNSSNSLTVNSSTRFLAIVAELHRFRLKTATLDMEDSCNSCEVRASNLAR